MSAKLDKALARLKSVLPLSERQNACDGPIRELHRQLLRSFVSRGRILTREEMAQHVGDLAHAINALRKSDLVTFSADGEPLGAYPFTMEAREHIVRVNGHSVHAMCALDALGISPMFGMDTQIDSRCRLSGDPVCIRQSGKTIGNLREAGEFHVGIAWGAAVAHACCADSLCREMIFLRDAELARQWLATDPANREVFTLPEAVEFAARVFVPLMSR